VAFANDDEAMLLLASVRLIIAFKGAEMQFTE
jgi:hypothetical protein